MKKQTRFILSIPVLALLFVGLLFLAVNSTTHVQGASLGGGTIPDLIVTAGVSSPTVKNGEKVTFTVDILNVGASAANDVVLTEYLPVPYVKLLDCQTNSPTGCESNGPAQIVKFPSIAFGQKRRITFVVEALSNYLHSTKTLHRAIVSSKSPDNNLLNNQSSAVIEFIKPVDLAISQQVALPPDLLPGSGVTLTLGVENIEKNPLFALQQHYFENREPITMPDTVLDQLQPALTYPSQITVTGIEKSVARVEVSLFAISRTWTEDIDVLLVGPTGVSVTLLSDVGGATNLGGAYLTFSDNASVDATSQDEIPSGTYRPTNFARIDESPVDFYPAPGPGDVFDPFPFLGRFNGLDPNGVWKLYIIDDQPRDDGVIRFGWGITFTELVTQDIPIFLTYDAPSIDSFNTISAPGWTVTQTARGFAASTFSDNENLLNEIIVQVTTPITPGTLLAESAVQPVLGESNFENNSVQSTVINTERSDLTFSGSVEPLEALYGETVTYTYVITNLGPTISLNGILKVIVADVLTVKVADSSIGSCAIAGAKVTCNSGVMAPLQSSDRMTVTLVATTPSDGVVGPIPLTTTALLEGNADPQMENNQVILQSTLARFVWSTVYLPIVAR